MNKMNTKLQYLRFYKNKLKLEGKSNESEYVFGQHNTIIYESDNSILVNFISISL